MTKYCECGNPVTDQFARVFGDNDDEVHACNECSTYREMKGGQAAGLEGKTDV